MRVRVEQGAIVTRATAGTNVVLFGIDISEDWARTNGLRGFTIERADHTENEKYFLSNFRRFKGFDDYPGSDVNPFQEFVWGDYTAKPAHHYTYSILARRGSPGALKSGPAVKLDVHTEDVHAKDASADGHLVYFNRGVAGSQAYAQRFHNEPPDKVAGGAAYTWLSRGLEEGLLRFIERAKDNRYALRAAFYEFTYESILRAFLNATKRGVDVKIVVDEKPNSKEKPRNANLDAIKLVGLESVVIPRETNPSYIAHNKFIVLLDGGKPIAVWTGSTNISEGGIFGQSNVGHAVTDEAVATTYFNYWSELAADPEGKELRNWTEDNSPLPTGQAQVVTVFSPRNSMDALNFYADCMREARESVFVTAAFGVNREFKAVLEEPRDFLRYVMLESLYVQKNRKRVKDPDIVILMKRDPNDRVAVGAYLKNDVLGRWVKEKLTNLNQHVRFVHDKFMLIDPLGPLPLVVTGSANFSEASTTKNDENMLFIRGNKRVADIYLTEFMRLFQHFDFRNRVMRVTANLKVERNVKAIKRGPGAPLDETDGWWERFFVKESPREKERLLFSARIA